MNNHLHKKIILGTANFGLNYGVKNKFKKLKISEIKRLLNFSIKKGISTIDTANSYGNAEKILGKCNHNRLKIITKILISKKKKNEIYNEILFQINQSRKNLKQKKIYAILIHNILGLNNSQIKFALEALQNLKGKGLINKMGISTYGNYKIKYITKFFTIDIIQTSVNILDKRAVTPELLKIYKKKKIEIHARSIFLQGLLVDKNLKVPKKIKKLWDKNKYKLFDIYSKNHAEPYEIALSIGFNNNIKKIVIGVDNLSQLKETFHLKRKKFKIPNVTFQKMNKIINPYLWK